MDDNKTDTCDDGEKNTTDSSCSTEKPQDEKKHEGECTEDKKKEGTCCGS